MEAILSVDKNEIVKLWREKLMMTFPPVQWQEMVPFHDCSVQHQFKDEKNLEQMQKRLCEREREIQIIGSMNLSMICLTVHIHLHLIVKTFQKR